MASTMSPTIVSKLCLVGLFALTTTASAAGLQQHDIRVDGMTCPFCVATSERALKKIDGVQVVVTDLENGRISVCSDDQVRFSDKQLKQLFLRNGFTFRSVTAAGDCSISEDAATKTGDHDHHHAGGKGHH